MAKILNLNSLAKEEKILTIDGTSYPMKDMSVEDFIELTRRAEAVDKKEDVGLADKIDTVCISFPTCPKTVLRKRSLEELNAIVEFARDTATEGVTETEGVEKKQETVAAQ